ncbi:C40 family peptidase [Nitratireductor aquibiodomus]|uniref:NlpC/P60 family protein n=1 Tax=Nitratireductor aquibiodomus TaxID=204799 RepID=UPI0019D3A3F6|nr:NlpC/P60 family protein [Nitratireductor aquibiodomus]MBN7759787.1 C40 family peptidase [Nitratireductor aquibiodomus]
MAHYQHLLGRQFEWQVKDCYGLLRDFYKDIFHVDLPNFARPEDFYQRGLNLFQEHYREVGFRELNVHPSEYKFGDVILCAIDSSFGNHCGVFVENGRVIHHLYGRLSEVSPFRGIVRNSCIGVYRHKDVTDVSAPQTEVKDLRDFLSPKKQKKLDELRATYSGPQEQAD